MVSRKKRAAPEEELRGAIIERPDGFYWQSQETGKEYGPFETLAEAEADRLAGGGDPEGEVEPETIADAESEAGINEWIDPDTGVPAEDGIPRLEDH
jgi:hypothetical protein